MSLPLLPPLPGTVFPGMNLATPNVNHQVRISLAILLLLVTVSGCTGSSTTEENRPTDASSQDTGKTATAAKKPAVEKKKDPPPAVAQVPAPAPLPLSDAELADGWIRLFDGSTLFGWQATTDADWQVVDGAITVSKGDQGLLCTTTAFSNYVLSVEFRSAKGTNSGIFLHTAPTPQDPAHDCYELNIADADNPFPTGSLVKRQKVNGSFDSTDWQRYEITVLGDTITVVLDGQEILQHQDAKPLQRGLIGLQLNEGLVAFRDIKLKPLQLAPLFNGKDLTGWKSYPEMASKFTVNDQGWLNVQDGRGQLETEQMLGDFILQLECITHAADLNSGIFFRCIPGDVMMGYECQIHNGVENQDATRPKDCGTGGFFRRQDARRVVAEDLKWFHQTLIVNGPHMAAWVNGYQVSDWTDTRPAHENPRKGLRQAAGTIMIQGHDPTTNISFRNLEAAELPTRSTPSIP
jgi:hypothetical protein